MDFMVFFLSWVYIMYEYIFKSKKMFAQAIIKIWGSLNEPGGVRGG